MHHFPTEPKDRPPFCPLFRDFYSEEGSIQKPSSKGKGERGRNCFSGDGERGKGGRAGRCFFFQKVAGGQDGKTLPIFKETIANLSLHSVRQKRKEVKNIVFVGNAMLFFFVYGIPG